MLCVSFLHLQTLQELFFYYTLCFWKVTEWVRNSGAKPLSTRMVWRGEIPPGLVRLSEVQAVTVPAWLLPSCQAQELPNSMATPRVGGHQVSPSSCFLLLRSRAPGAQGCPAPPACQLPGAPAPEEPPGACLGSSPAPRAGRCAGSRAPSSPAPLPCRLPCQMDRQKAGSIHGHLPRQSGNLGSWGEYFGF